MRTAIDTNILFDLLLPDTRFLLSSKVALERQFSQGSLLIGEIVYSELAAFFSSRPVLDETLRTMGIQFIPSTEEVCWRAGETWKKYRRGGGKRGRVLADFFIAAHSQVHADALLTRDRGFYRRYFSDLPLIEP